MFSRNRVDTTRAEQPSRNMTGCSLCPRCAHCLPSHEDLAGLFKGTSNLPKQVGVSTYLALTFGTLLSSQGTDASFVLTRRTLSGAFLRALPFGLAFPTLSDSFVSDSRSKRASHFTFQEFA